MIVSRGKWPGGASPRKRTATADSSSSESRLRSIPFCAIRCSICCIMNSDMVVPLTRNKSFSHIKIMPSRPRIRFSANVHGWHVPSSNCTAQFQRHRCPLSPFQFGCDEATSSDDPGQCPFQDLYVA